MSEPGSSSPAWIAAAAAVVGAACAWWQAWLAKKQVRVAFLDDLFQLGQEGLAVVAW